MSRPRSYHENFDQKFVSSAMSFYKQFSDRASVVSSECFCFLHLKKLRRAKFESDNIMVWAGYQPAFYYLKNISGSAVNRERFECLQLCG